MNMSSLSDWASEDNEILAELSTEETLAQMNQMDKVKHLLLSNINGVCHNVFMEHYIPRFGALIFKLRHDENWMIEKVRCDLHD